MSDLETGASARNSAEADKIELAGNDGAAPVLKVRPDPRPLYLRAEEALGRVLDDYGAGERLPPEPELARRMGISRATLREAMRPYEEKGLIIRKQGVGTFVTGPHPVIESGLEVLESIETLASRMGLAVEVGALEVDRHPADEDEARTLEVEPGTPLTRVERVMLAEARPVAFLIDTLPTSILEPEGLDAGFAGSVLDLLLARGGLRLDRSRTEIRAVSADARAARRLAIQRGDPLLHFVSWLYDTRGCPVDHSHSYFVPGYFRFDVIRRVGRRR